MAPTNATYQDIEGSQSLLALTLDERMLELEKNTIKKPSMLVKVMCALAVAATVGIAYTTGHSVGHGAVTNFAAYRQDPDNAPAYGFYDPFDGGAHKRTVCKGDTPTCIW